MLHCYLLEIVPCYWKGYTYLVTHHHWWRQCKIDWSKESGLPGGIEFLIISLQKHTHTDRRTHFPAQHSWGGKELDIPRHHSQTTASCHVCQTRVVGQRASPHTSLLHLEVCQLCWVYQNYSEKVTAEFNTRRVRQVKPRQTDRERERL